MFYAVVLACTLQSQCIILGDKHNPHETVDQCEAHISEMMNVIPEAMGGIFGPVRFQAQTACMTELEYVSFISDMEKASQDYNNGL